MISSIYNVCLEKINGVKYTHSNVFKIGSLSLFAFSWNLFIKFGNNTRECICKHLVHQKKKRKKSICRHFFHEIYIYIFMLAFLSFIFLIGRFFKAYSLITLTKFQQINKVFI